MGTLVPGFIMGLQNFKGTLITVDHVRNANAIIIVASRVIPENFLNFRD